jgi:HK97 gp10 family phage protein
MANNNGFDGMDKLMDRLRKAPTNVVNKVSQIIKAGAQDIAGEAKQRAPVDQGFLKNEISAKENDPLESEVVSANVISPYVEFGTGEKVQIPNGLAEYAAQFKGDFASGTLSLGGHLTFKEAIFAWCKRKGIEEELWYPIYISIGIHGIEAQPFFFPAANRVYPIIINQVEKALKDVI